MEKGWLAKVFKDCELRYEAMRLSQTGDRKQLTAAIRAARAAGWSDPTSPASSQETPE